MYTCMCTYTFNMYLGSLTHVCQPDMGSCKRLLGINMFRGPSWTILGWITLTISCTEEMTAIFQNGHPTISYYVEYLDSINNNIVMQDQINSYLIDKCFKVMWDCWILTKNCLPSVILGYWSSNWQQNKMAVIFQFFFFCPFVEAFHEK